MAVQNAPSTAVTLLVADDRPVVRQGWRALLRPEAGFQVVGEASDGLEALRLAGRLRPHVLVLELKIPGLSAVETVRRVRQRVPEMRIVILSRHFRETEVRQLVRAGVAACVVEDAGVDQLVEAIREVMADGQYFSPPLVPPPAGARAPRPAERSTDPQQRLTPREREIIGWTISGHTSAEIADLLHISRRTVESHRANILRKLGLRNQKDLIRYAVQWGMEAAE